MDEERPLRVSVVIPVYNRVVLLPRALRSVQAQTFQDFEIIVVDDASTEDVETVVKEAGHGRIRYLRLDRNGRAGRARNAGTEAARGEWVAFLDSDDEWLPDKLEKQLRLTDEDPTIAVVQCWCYLEEDGVRKASRERALANGDGFDGLLHGGRSIAPSAFVIKRSALLASGGFDETLRFAGDLDVLFRLAERSFQFAGLEERLVIYHKHNHGRMSDDAMARLADFHMLNQRWGPQIKARLGADGYRLWRKRRFRYVRRGHKRYVAAIVASGDRGAAWRYVLQVSPSFWSLRRQVRKALLFAAAGL